MGDSRLSWTHGDEPATFWPEWLAEEKDFMNVRIHTWGYHETTVSDKVAVSGLRDTGKDLCEALEQNNGIRTCGLVWWNSCTDVHD